MVTPNRGQKRLVELEDLHLDNSVVNEFGAGRLPAGPNVEGKIAKKMVRANQFLNSFRQSGVIAYSCRAANIGYTTVGDWRNPMLDDDVIDPAEVEFRLWFRKQFDAAREEADSSLEGEVYRRAAVGVDKPVYQGGKHVGTVREYSDLLLIFLTKARMPERFRDNFGVQIGDTYKLTVNQNQVVNAIVGLPEDELMRLATRGRLLEAPVESPVT